MALSSSLFSGLTGLAAHQTRMDVIGDNISNVNTVGFKSERVLFETAFARTLSIGSSPSGQLAGVNPEQIGQGVQVASVTRNFEQGAIQTTGQKTDLAIEGQGFFVLNDESGSPVYTRDGSFTLNPQLYLANSAGYYVQGFMADANYQVTPSGSVAPIRIPIGELTIAKATENATFTGNLNGSGEVATTGTELLSNAFVDNTGATATAATALTNLRIAGALGTPLFSVGDVITLNCNKGTRSIPQATFTVAAGSTFGGASSTTSLSAWLETRLGINTDASVPLSPGVSIDAGGKLDINGNGGTANALKLLKLNNTTASTSPFTFTEAQSADGESFSSPFTAYNSLGTPVVVNVTFSMESKATAGNTWRWYAETSSDATGKLSVGTGTILFADNGTFGSDSGNSISINQAGIGAQTPLLISPDFASLTQLMDNQSGVALTYQDGSSQGTLTDMQVGQDGIVVGIFNNGQLRNLAQIALANFANTNGLFNSGNNIYKLGPDSGAPMISTPGQLGSGKIVSSSLEQSNVDLATEFVDLIVTSAGFSANSRVITTSDEMLKELLQISR
jgi:flagellar hook protein FlgE